MPILKLNDLKKHKREETKRRKKTITQTINTFMKMLQRIQAAKIRSKSSSNSMPLNRKMLSLQMMKKLRFQKTSLLRFFKKRCIKIAEPLSLMNRSRVGTSLLHMKTLTKKMIKMVMSTKVTKMTMKNNIVKIEMD